MVVAIKILVFIKKVIPVAKLPVQKHFPLCIQGR